MLTSLEMQNMTAHLTTKSDKIRVLNKAGVSRADIARFLGIRYQQVRNTLVGDESTGYEPVLAAANTSPQTSPSLPLTSSATIVTIGSNGEGIIPPDVLDAYRAHKNEQLVMVNLNDGLLITTASLALKRLERTKS